MISITKRMSGTSDFHKLHFMMTDRKLQSILAAPTKTYN